MEAHPRTGYEVSLMASSNKEINKLIKAITKQAGWRVRESKHIMVYAPDGQTIITISKSPNAGSTAKIRKQLIDAGAVL